MSFSWHRTVAKSWDCRRRYEFFGNSQSECSSEKKKGETDTFTFIHTPPPQQCSTCKVLSLEGRSPSDAQVNLSNAIQDSHWGIPEGGMSRSLDVSL
ncbi:uncharacterized protein [Pocillopora verrucosa]|uniref:uncharacterized protein isoform X2 n=1 Tax=Pocillopora verrucosa TaxID=203993 RepID=UPI00333EBBA9